MNKWLRCTFYYFFFGGPHCLLWYYANIFSMSHERRGLRKCNTQVHMLSGGKWGRNAVYNSRGREGFILNGVRIMNLSINLRPIYSERVTLKDGICALKIGWHSVIEISNFFSNLFFPSPFIQAVPSSSPVPAPPRPTVTTVLSTSMSSLSPFSLLLSLFTPSTLPPPW